MYPPRLPEPPTPPPPTPPKYSGGRDEGIGLALIALAALAIWRFGIWWGLGLYGAALALLAFVGAVNTVSAESASGGRGRRNRGPIWAQLHAAGSALLGGVLGYGVASLVGLATSRGFTGIAAVAAVFMLISEAGGRALDMDWSGALGSWCLFMFAWTVILVPLAAYVAPGYELNGFGANFGAVVCVFAAEWLVWRASPWRWRWTTLPK